MKRISKTTLKMRKELSMLSNRELADICSIRISFKDTAPRSMIQMFYLRQRLAQDMLYLRIGKLGPVDPLAAEKLQ
jgi:hypothetical protein